ncbi:MAG: hypothetical protein EOO63_00370 [Hymenobacter sp.]|nr:MAG: hypothetical protein EOO63_00370 [Hymenobacter sp.]
MATCLCTQPVNDLLRGYPYADTVRQLTAFITLEPALKLPGACNGIYYFYLRSPHWKTPAFRGSTYTYHYLVILDQHLTVFAGQDPASSRKYRAIRKTLIQAIGKPKTDSLKRELLVGYRQLRG